MAGNSTQAAVKDTVVKGAEPSGCTKVISENRVCRRTWGTSLHWRHSPNAFQHSTALTCNREQWVPTIDRASQLLLPSARQANCDVHMPGAEGSLIITRFWGHLCCVMLGKNSPISPGHQAHGFKFHVSNEWCQGYPPLELLPLVVFRQVSVISPWSIVATGLWPAWRPAAGIATACLLTIPLLIAHHHHLWHRQLLYIIIPDELW